ncbi:hypothetical protein CHS0354_011056, partial [Potamilus streckersoni]
MGTDGSKLSRARAHCSNSGDLGEDITQGRDYPITAHNTKTSKAFIFSASLSVLRTLKS